MRSLPGGRPDRDAAARNRHWRGLAAGVQEHDLPRLFERFYRAPNAQDMKAKGIGLGLYLVAELLHMHGGAIRVESSGVFGEGSRFIFTLPMLERETIARV